MTYLFIPTNWQIWCSFLCLLSITSNRTRCTNLVYHKEKNEVFQLISFPGVGYKIMHTSLICKIQKFINVFPQKKSLQPNWPYQVKHYQICTIPTYDLAHSNCSCTNFLFRFNYFLNYRNWCDETWRSNVSMLMTFNFTGGKGKKIKKIEKEKEKKKKFSDYHHETSTFDCKNETNTEQIWFLFLPISN